VERSIEMVVALLAVLKAGGAYVPLDPSHPAERLNSMLIDSGATVLLTQTQLQSLFSIGVWERIVVLDLMDAVIWQDQPRSNPERSKVGLTPDHLAYVIYTSGSTNKPKGVMIPHRALTNFINSMLAEPGIGPRDVLLSVTTFSFDIAALELYLPLIVGAQVRIANLAASLNGESLLKELQQGVTMMQATPASWQMLIEAGWKGSPGLKGLCGGEALNGSLARELAARSSSTWNMYGPTETTVWSLMERIAVSRDVVTVGKPIANTQVYILDAMQQPVPVGVAGEIYIGGAGAARGYLNRAELTAERFVPDPFRQARGARMYRTGDLGRWLQDGNIEYLGRNDFQVKVRGFRIELGEIETRLREYKAVREAMVVAREDRPGVQRLVAYYTTTGIGETEGTPHPTGVGASAEELRRHVAKKLPDYMVPSAYVWMQELPRTVNGKLDRRALPAPERGAFATASYQAPCGEVETMLASIWAEVLKVEQVGRYDNFFELGGHSLIIIQVAAKVRSAFGLNLPLRTFFEQPTLAGLAQRISQNAASTTSPTAKDISVVSRERPLPLTVGEEFLWLMAQFSPSYATQHLSLGWRFRGPLDACALERSVNEIIRRQEVLRTTFSTRGIGKYLLRLLIHAARSSGSRAPRRKRQQGKWIGHLASRAGRSKLLGAPASRLMGFVRAMIGHPVRVIAPFITIPLSRVDLGDDPGIDREQIARRLADDEVSRAIDLAKGPLLRMKLFRMDEEDHLFLLTVHHVVFDGWSHAIFVRELQSCYESYCAGQMPDLPELRIQYADYAAWRSAQMEGEVFHQQLEYWKDRLRGFPSELPLPVDSPRQAVSSLPSASIAFVISRAQTQGLKRLSQREGTTLFMVLLAVFQLLLYRLSGLEDMAVAVPFAQRGHPELEKLIGFFMGMVVVRTDLSGKPAFHELLHRVGETCQEAYTHSSPAVLKAVMHEAGVQGFAQARGSIFKAFFNWVSVPTHDLELPGLITEPILLRVETSDLGPDVVLEGSEAGETIDLRIIYKEPLFSAARMEKFTQQFMMLVSQVIEEPKKAITEYCLDTPQEQAPLVSTAVEVQVE
jgi:amino acid adenylation domain-containing protein